MKWLMSPDGLTAVNADRIDSITLNGGEFYTYPDRALLAEYNADEDLLVELLEYVIRWISAGDDGERLQLPEDADYKITQLINDGGREDW